jgi:hypothetical protein
MNYVCYDARGKSDGETANTITGDHAGHANDYVPLVVSMDEVEPLAFIKNDAGGVQQGYWRGLFPTLRTEITPAIAYSLSFCDANGRRKDRPNGGVCMSPFVYGTNIPRTTVSRTNHDCDDRKTSGIRKSAHRQKVKLKYIFYSSFTK